MKVPAKKPSRFDKIVKHIVQKGSPSINTPLTDNDDDEMGVEEEADAVGQEGKPVKRKAKDINPNDLF